MEMLREHKVPKRSLIIEIPNRSVECILSYIVVSGAEDERD